MDTWYVTLINCSTDKMSNKIMTQRDSCFWQILTKSKLNWWYSDLCVMNINFHLRYLPDDVKFGVAACAIAIRGHMTTKVQVQESIRTLYYSDSYSGHDPSLVYKCLRMQSTIHLSVTLFRIWKTWWTMNDERPVQLILDEITMLKIFLHHPRVQSAMWNSDIYNSSNSPKDSSVYHQQVGRDDSISALQQTS